MKANGRKKLIVNADDFGLSQGINLGIIEAHKNGIVTSTSIVANGRFFHQAVEFAKENSKLGVGVHLTLIEENSILPQTLIPNLVSTNQSLPKKHFFLISKVLSKRINLKEIERELRSQIEVCISKGIYPTHLDSHQHVHMIPCILDVVIKLAKDYGIQYIRFPYESFCMGKKTFKLNINFKTLALNLFCLLAKNKLDKAKISCVDNFYGLSLSGSLNTKFLREIIDNLSYGYNEIVCHPGYLDETTYNSYSHWGYQWEKELEALTSGPIKKLINKKNIQLINYRDLMSI